MEIIKEADRNYINLLVIVIRKDNTIRLCIAALEFNDVIEGDHAQTWAIEELNQRCGKIGCTSKIDLTISFWQLPLHEKSKQYTAFMLEGLVYIFNVVHFGTKNSITDLVKGLNPVLKNSKT